MQNPQYVKLAAENLKNRLSEVLSGAAPCAVILGTGLSDSVASLCPDAIAVPFAQIPHFPNSGVKSHTGQFLAGCIQGMPVIFQQGRCHLYEGRSPAEVCMGVRVMAMLGCRELIVTNAAGSINPLFPAGQLMLIADQINNTGVSPLTGLQDGDFGPQFPDMCAVFDPVLRAFAKKCAMDLKIPLCEGVYIGVHGPEMETPAETRMYRHWGADAIGMSTVLETIAASQLGLKTLGISCLTNQNLPDNMTPTPIEEVVHTAAQTGPDLARLLAALLRNLAEQRQQESSLC